MHNSFYILMYLIVNAFRTYVIYRFMKIFLERCRLTRKMEFTAYFVYYILVSLQYLIADIPLLTLAVNILGMLVLVRFYDSTWRLRMAAVLFCYVLLITLESIVFFLSGHLEYTLSASNAYRSFIGVFAANVLPYMAVLLMDRAKHIKKGEEVPYTYWAAVLFIPMSSVYLMISIFKSNGLGHYEIIAAIVILFSANILVFYLYDVLSGMQEKELERAIVQQENRYYKNQYAVMIASQENEKALRHDLKNHLTILQGFLEMEESKKAYGYIKKLVDVAHTVERHFPVLQNHPLQSNSFPVCIRDLLLACRFLQHAFFLY